MSIDRIDEIKEDKSEERESSGDSTSEMGSGDDDFMDEIE